MSAKRNRLTDLKCGWKHGNDQERLEFLAWIASDEAAEHWPPYVAREGSFGVNLAYEAGEALRSVRDLGEVFGDRPPPGATATAALGPQNVETGASYVESDEYTDREYELRRELAYGRGGEG